MPTAYQARAQRIAAAIFALLSVTLAAGPGTTALAKPTAQPAPGEPTRVQRSIADDPRVDANLVARLPVEFNSVWPTSGEITTYFGEVDRLSPRGHSGLDIAGPEGTPVVAADVGEVLKAYWNKEGYGGLIIIAHPSGYETWYGHLDSFDVDQGQQVKRGEQIGLMGSTGYSTGAHLHFEVRQEGQLRDPLTFLDEANLQPAEPAQAVVAGRR